MRILLIGMPFYEYINQIKKGICSEMDAQVDVLILQKLSSTFENMLNKLTKGKYLKKKDYVIQKKFFMQKCKVEYDYIFVIVGRGIDERLFGNFIFHQRKSRKILYLWDDINRINNYHNIKNFFDNIFSFDEEDCYNEKLDFLPLFYCDDFVYKGEKKVYDISCIGSLHSDRKKIMDKILNVFSKEKYNWYALLKVTKLYFIGDFLRNKRIKKPEFYLGYKEINMKKNAEILKQSRVVIDIPYVGQKGLSIRSLEALAANAKLITTNSSIKKYDFYNEYNIHIIDRENPSVDEEFISRPYHSIESNIVNQYSLSEWIKRIFA